MKFVELNSVDDIDRDQWRTLWEHSTDAGVFQTREWMLSWVSIFAPSAADVKLITAWQGERLIGIAPFARSAMNVRAGQDEWNLLGDDYSDYQTFLAWDDSPQIVEAMLDVVHKCVPHPARLALRDVPQYSTLGMVLTERSSRPGSMITAGEFTACPTLRIKGNELGLARVLGKSSLRRCERGLRKLGQVTVEHVTAPAEISRSLPALFSQHVRRWSDTPYPSLFLKRANQRFFEVTADAMEVGTLLYSTVRVDNHVVAQHFGLQSKRSLLWYKPAFDIDFRQHSPGEVLIESLIRYARDHELEEFDFTRGDEAFKSRFASLVSYNRSFLWHRARLALWRRKAAHSKARLGRFLARPKPEIERLGGVAVAPGGINRALVLDASDKSSMDFATSLASHGVEVHVAGSGRVRADSTLKYFEQPAADNAASWVEWLVELCRKQQYSLIVPTSASSVSMLSPLQQDHPLRLRCLLMAGDQHAKGLARIESPVTLPSNEKALRAAVRDVCILALYVHGRMVNCYVEAPNDQGEAVRIQSAARRALDALAWHGPATIYGELTAADEIVLKRIEPFFGRSLDAALRAGVQFPLSMWRAITGQRCKPQ